MEFLDLGISLAPNRTFFGKHIEDACLPVTECPIVKRFSYRRHYHRQLIRDTFLLVGTPILMLIAILWSLQEEWVYSRLRHVLMSFVDSFLSRLM